MGWPERYAYPCPWVDASNVLAERRGSNGHCWQIWMPPMSSSIAAPLYNLSVPALFKAWIDPICRIGVSFDTDSGPQWVLATGRYIS